jgi:hypothetical protein
MTVKNDIVPAGTLATSPVLSSGTQEAVTAVMVGGIEYEVIQAVNLPTLKHETGQVVAVRIDGPIQVKTNTETKAAKVNGVDTVVTENKELSVVRLTELSSGQQFTYPMNAIAAANLIDGYPDDGYIGLCFAIKKGAVVAGKRYKDIQIVEIKPKAV